MRIRKGIPVLLVVLLLSCILYAKDFWEKPYNQWSSKDTTKMLTDSPWSKVMTLADQVRDDKKGYQEDRTGPTAGRGNSAGAGVGADPRDVTDSSRGYGADRGSGISGEKEIYDRYTVRFFSAPTVRQAHVRTVQIAQNYDKMPAEQKQAFDVKMSKALEITFPDTVVVAVDFTSNNRQLWMEVNRQMMQITKDQLKQKVYLITDRRGRIELSDYYPPSPDGTGAKFIFPRKVNNEPIINAEDKAIRFELFVPGTGTVTKSGDDIKVFVEWKVEKMLQNGEPLL